MEKQVQFQSILGIMVCQIKQTLFFEKGFYRFLQKLGHNHHILVYVFYPNTVDWDRKQVKGFYYNFSINKWDTGWFPLPDYIYDRCFYTNSKQFNYYKSYIAQIKKDKNITFLGNGLSGKWEVYQILSNHPSFRPFLPRTEIYQNFSQLLSWLNQYPVVLKPIGGSHGIGVIKISKQNKLYEIIGRDAQNNHIKNSFSSAKSLSIWIKHFVSKRKYLIQQYLDLTTSNSEPYDVRILVQKNMRGSWELTGMAARIGSKESITSNLHGGGTVSQADQLLRIEHGEAKANEILQKLDRLAQTIPLQLEKHHGDLFELGLDVGIDKQGNIWIIEVNSKPGRTVFTLLDNPALIYKSKIQPIMYTLFLSKKKVGGKVI